MMEIVPAEPIEGIYFEQGESSTARSHDPLAITSVSNSGGDVGYVPGPFDSERLPTVFASEIERFLRVANLVGKEEPRVAYLCESFFFSRFSILGVYIFFFTKMFEMIENTSDYGIGRQWPAEAHSWVGVPGIFSRRVAHQLRFYLT